MQSNTNTHFLDSPVAKIQEFQQDSMFVYPTDKTCRVYYNHSKNSSYLKLGTGNPCAGQRIANDFFSEQKNQLILLLVEKLGAFAPTGSKKNEQGKLLTVYKNPLKYLNVGTGKA